MPRAALMIVVVVCAVAAVAWASSTPYEPPEGGDKGQKVDVPLKGTDIDRDATGKAILACNVAETHHRIQLFAKNVEEEGVYSIWLVKYDVEKQKVIGQVRVDDPERPLKSDKYGKLAFASNIEACPQGKFNRVEVRYHADGKADNIKDAKTAAAGIVP